MDGSESRSGLVLELAEEFLDRYRDGQRPALKEYTDRYPELAGEILEVFPAMAMMEHIALADESLAGSATGMAAAPAGQPVRHDQLGDFRIIREVGRGGMGVVYEAEQVSLGRHVALKVLPRQMIDDPRQRRRFEREARAAAKLHHTNIVPVFGVGEHEGTPYYVMQFILGLGLDEVLEELRRLRTAKGKGAEQSVDSGGALRISRRDVSAADVARSLMTGRFEPEPFETPGTTPLAATIDQPPSSAEPSPEPVSMPTNGRSSSSFAAGSSSVVLPGKGSGARKAPTYGQSVAQIGVQVAEALEYAHKQGILHRDVKPSNLLLDTRGTVWVADFGLAKANDQANLTLTGDLLGTLRYMPPEAFEGKSDARGDVYSLGLTLYELLAFRPAFDEKERGRLVKQVTHDAPPRLSTVAADVPRDLETIVHKAIERDSSHRYATAGELAADLQRFLDDEPIQARRTSPAERLGRWARHNPLVASLGAAVFGLMAMLALGSTIAAWRIDREKVTAQTAAIRETEAARRASLAAERATRALAAEEASRRSAEAAAARETQARKAVEVANADLRSARDRVRAGLYAAEMNLLQIAWKEEDTDRVRELLARTVPRPGEPDMRGFEWWYWQRQTRAEVASLRLPEPIDYIGVLSGDGARAACPSRSAGAGQSEDRVCVYDTTTGRELLERRVSGANSLTLALDRAGTRLAAAWIVEPVPGSRAARMVELRVWDVSEGREILSVVSEIGAPGPNTYIRRELKISADGTRVALALGPLAGPKGGSEHCEVKVWDMADGRDVWHTSVEGAVSLLDLAIRQDGGMVVASLVSLGKSSPGEIAPTRNMLRAWAMPEGHETLFLSDSAPYYRGLAFRPDGARLAVLRQDTIGRMSIDSASIQVLDTSSGQILRSSDLTGRDIPTELAYSPDGTRIAGFGGFRSPVIRVWDAETGALRFHLRGVAHRVTRVAFRSDGLGLIAAGDRTIQQWDVSADRDTSGAPASGRELPSSSSLGLGSDGTRLAIVAPGANGRVEEVTVYDAATRVALSRGFKPLPFRSADQSLELVFSPDNARLASWMKSNPGVTERRTLPPESVGVTLAGKGASFFVSSIVTGGSADLDGRLRVGDMVIGLEREDGTRVEFAGRVLADVVKLIRGPAWSRVRLIVRAPDADRTTTCELTRWGFPPPRVQLWDAASGAGWTIAVAEPGPAAQAARVEQVVFHPDGSTIAVLALVPPPRSAPGANLITRVQIRDAALGRLIGDWAVPATTLTALAYSPDGHVLAVAGETASKGKRLRQILLLDPADGRVLRTIPVETAHPLVKLLYRPDGAAIAGLSWQPRVELATDLAVWDLADGREIFKIKDLSYLTSPSLYVQLAFSPDSRRLAAARRSGLQRNEVRLWDTATGQELISLSREGLTPQGLAFDRAGQRLLLLQGYSYATPRLTGRLVVLDASPLSPETLAGEQIDALAAKFPLHDELRAQLTSDTSLPAEVRAAVGRVLEGRAESVYRLCAVSLELSRRPDQPVAEYERALRYAEAAARQRPDDPEVLAALGTALVRLDRDAPRARTALTRAAELEDLIGLSHTATLDRKIAAEPRNLTLFMERANVHARDRRWAAALADYETALALDPQFYGRYYRIATLAAFLGDRDRYARVSRAMFDRFGSSQNHQAVERTVKTGLLLPGAVTPLAAPLRTLETALAEGKGDSTFPGLALNALALADMRSGRPSAALERIVLAKKAPASTAMTAMTLSIEAICLLDVGLEGKARAALKQARTILAPIFPTAGARPAAPLSDFWHEILVAQILYREAEVRLLDAGFPADPFVPLAQ